MSEWDPFMIVFVVCTPSYQEVKKKEENTNNICIFIIIIFFLNEVTLRHPGTLGRVKSKDKRGHRNIDIIK